MKNINKVSINQVKKELENFEKINQEIVWRWQQDHRILNTIADDYNDLKSDISLKEYLTLLIEEEIYDKY